MLYLWLKAFHIIFVVTWFAGLFYLPRLFVYHADTHDTEGRERFKVMERKLLGIMTLGAAIAVACGIWLAALNWPAYAHAGWFHLKLLLVVSLIGYHVYCYRLVRDFRADRNRHSHVFYRWVNEYPALVLIAVVLLVVLKP